MAAVEKLSALKIKNLSEPGRYGDGGGLWLQVRSKENKSWIFRYKVGGKAHWHGLGDLADVSLAQARKDRIRCKELLRSGIDPIMAGKAKKAELLAEKAKLVSFKDATERYLAAKRHEWTHKKQEEQWQNSLTRYAYPVIGAMPVSAIATHHVLQVLEKPCVEKDETGQVLRFIENPWVDVNETASRVRGRIEAVLNFAKVRGWCAGENPARWRGHLDQILPKPSKVQKDKSKHFAALPWTEIGAFMEAIADESGVGALALRFAILTAARSGEVRGATWGEIDTARAVWIVPGDRMKAGREHRVPLSEPTLAILREVEALRDTKNGDLVFPGAKLGKPLSDTSLTAVLRRMGRGDLTAHGFRSTFRDWAGETGHASDIAEAALAHTLGGKVQQAYQRGDLLDRRKHLMAAWATFCGRVQPAGGNVATLEHVKAA